MVKSKLFALYGGPFSGIPESVPFQDRVWEDLNLDEQVEKLMWTVTWLWERNIANQKLISELKIHQHDNKGDVFIRRYPGQDYDEELDETTRNKNPFNSTGVKDKQQRG